MSTTPRTDHQATIPTLQSGLGMSAFIPADFARQLETELQELQAWKDSALQLETEWDEQAIAKMLGAKPGESCRKVIMKRVPEILAELEAARLDAGRLAVCLRAAEDDCDIGSSGRRALALHETRIKKL